MGRGCPPHFYNSHSMCRHPCCRLDLQVWGAGCHHNGQEGQIHFSRLGVLCNQLGIQHITTTAFLPQSNGLVECFHRQLKDSFWARLAGREWTAHLPWVLLGLRATSKEDHKILAG